MPQYSNQHIVITQCYLLLVAVGVILRLKYFHYKIVLIVYGSRQRKTKISPKNSAQKMPDPPSQRSGTVAHLLVGICNIRLILLVVILSLWSFLFPCPLLLIKKKLNKNKTKNTVFYCKESNQERHSQSISSLPTQRKTECMTYIKDIFNAYK